MYSIYDLLNMPFWKGSAPPHQKVEPPGQKAENSQQGWISSKLFKVCEYPIEKLILDVFCGTWPEGRKQPARPDQQHTSPKYVEPVTNSSNLAKSFNSY